MSRVCSTTCTTDFPFRDQSGKRTDQHTSQKWLFHLCVLFLHFSSFPSRRMTMMKIATKLHGLTCPSEAFFPPPYVRRLYRLGMVSARRRQDMGMRLIPPLIPTPCVCVCVRAVLPVWCGICNNGQRTWNGRSRELESPLNFLFILVKAEFVDIAPLRLSFSCLAAVCLKFPTPLYPTFIPIYPQNLIWVLTFYRKRFKLSLLSNYYLKWSFYV